MSDNRNALSGLNLFLQPPVSGPLNALFHAPTILGSAGASPLARVPPPPRTLLSYAMDKYRRREKWNDRFQHWEKPASVTEEGTIERARRNVQLAIGQNHWLVGQRVAVQPQGSYHNNTNTRREADIDLRVCHPLLKIDYSQDVVRQYADNALDYSYPGVSLDWLFETMRSELQASLSAAFGAKNVIPGNKAFRVRGITGSRAEVDVVPTVGYHKVIWSPPLMRYLTVQGIAILSTDGRWTINFPEQHHLNGIYKRAETGHQFKRVVRILKRLRADMTERGVLAVKVPSFLVECLVYAVEDAYFTVATDDRYDRVRRVATRIQAMVNDEPTAARMMEINGVKSLFTAEQAWSWHDARVFMDAVVAHLGDA